MAGVVYENKNKMANRNWGEISGDELGKLFNIPIFKLYNDFEFISYSVVKIKEEEFIPINDAKKSLSSPMVYLIIIITIKIFL